MKQLETEQRLFAARAVSQYQADLAADTAGQAYLTLRGIDQATAQRFRLGVATSPLAGHEAYRGRLAIPYLTPFGPVAIRFRCIQQHDCKEAGHPKYLSQEGIQNHLFNVAALKADSSVLCVTEGEIDAITLDMCGIPAVGVSGANAWEEHFKLCLEDFDTVYALGDGDAAGAKFSSFLAREVGARSIKLPEGSDVNDVYRSGGAQALRALIPG